MKATTSVDGWSNKGWGSQGYHMNQPRHRSKEQRIDVVLVCAQYAYTKLLMGSVISSAYSLTTIRVANEDTLIYDTCTGTLYGMSQNGDYILKSTTLLPTVFPFLILSTASGSLSMGYTAV